MPGAEGGCWWLGEYQAVLSMAAWAGPLQVWRVWEQSQVACALFKSSD